MFLAAFLSQITFRSEARHASVHFWSSRQYCNLNCFTKTDGRKVCVDDNGLWKLPRSCVCRRVWATLGFIIMHNFLALFNYCGKHLCICSICATHRTCARGCKTLHTPRRNLIVWCLKTSPKYKDQQHLKIQNKLLNNNTNGLKTT